ncbi:MAG: twin-arginine translocation signal domain-containing protein [Opitutus sp.]|nr:twin-arginine translocation signal domain-containing protein [Opitutus sp.]
MKAPHDSSPLSRRRFVGNFAVGATALAFGSKAFEQTATSPKKLGIAIVGRGGYASGQLAPALKMTQHVEVRGVVTGSPEKGQKWRDVFGFRATSIYSYETMHRMADN